MKKDLKTTLEELIGEIVKLSEEDPLKAYVYLQYKLREAPIEITEGLPVVWSIRKDWQKEIQRVSKGTEKLRKLLEPKIEELRSKEIERLYKEWFE